MLRSSEAAESSKESKRGASDFSDLRGALVNGPLVRIEDLEGARCLLPIAKWKGVLPVRAR